MKSNLPLSNGLALLNLSNHYQLFNNSYITLEYITFKSFLTNINLLTFTLRNPQFCKQFLSLMSSHKSVTNLSYALPRGSKAKRTSLLNLVNLSTRKINPFNEKITRTTQYSLHYHKQLFRYESKFRSNSLSTLFPYTEPCKEALTISSKQSSTVNILESAYKFKYRSYRRRLALYLLISNLKSSFILSTIRPFYKVNKKPLELRKISRPTPLARVLAFLNNKRPFHGTLSLNDYLPLKTSQLNLNYKTYARFYRNFNSPSLNSNPFNPTNPSYLYSPAFLKNFYHTTSGSKVFYGTHRLVRAKIAEVESSYTSTARGLLFRSYFKNFKKAFFKKRFNMRYYKVNTYNLKGLGYRFTNFNRSNLGKSFNTFGLYPWLLNLVFCSLRASAATSSKVYLNSTLIGFLKKQFCLLSPSTFSCVSNFQLQINSNLVKCILPTSSNILVDSTLTHFSRFVKTNGIELNTSLGNYLTKTNTTLFNLRSIKQTLTSTSMKYFLLKNSSETTFILSNVGFLFTTSRNLPLKSVGFTDLRGIKARVNKTRLSFFYKEDLKKTLLRRPGVSKWLNSFNGRGVLLNSSYNSTQSLVLENFKNQSYTTPSLKGNLMSNFFTNSLDSFRFLNWQSLNLPNLTMPNDLTLNRIRFKPGYQRIWRRARTSLNYLMGFKFRYQNRLTKKISRIRRLSRNQYLKLAELSLGQLLLNSRMVLDLNSSSSLIHSNTVFVNGSSISNPNLTVFTNDFIQIIVNLRFYIVYKWILNWNTYNLTKMRKLISSKSNSSKSDLSKQVSRSLPDWIFNTSFKKIDIPKYLEVDYFTLSIFVLYRPLNWSDYHPYTHLWDRSDIYSLYNWKYIT